MFSFFSAEQLRSFVLVHLRYFVGSQKHGKEYLWQGLPRYGRSSRRTAAGLSQIAQECILLMFIKAPSVDIGIHQIEESP